MTRKAPLRRLEHLETRRCLAVTFPISHIVDSHELASVRKIDSLDFDGDGDIDILSTSSAQRVAKLHLNDGAGNFETITLPGTFSSPFPIAGGDIDNDGQPDVVVGDFDGGTVHWIKATKFGDQLLFGEPREIGRGLGDVREARLADLDGDDDLDLVIANGKQLNWFANRDGQGDFSARRNLFDINLSNLVIPAIDVVDLDGKGQLDVLAGAFRNSGVGNPLVAVHQSAEGDFSGVMALSEFRGSISAVASGDFNQDGDMDIVYADEGGTVGVFTRQDDESYAFAVAVTRDLPSVRHIVAHDVDQDGDLDLIITSIGANRVSVAFGEPDTEFLFRQPSTVFSVANPRSLSIADVDGDGDSDILLGVDGGTQSRILWLEQRVLGDVNNDGRFNSSDLVAVFQAGEYEDDLADNSTFATGDWNGDGDFTTADLVAAFQAGAYTATAIIDSTFADL